MATATATAAAAAASVLLCLMHGRCCGIKEGEDEGRDRKALVRQQESENRRRRGIPRPPAMPPSTWWEAAGMAVTTVMFVLSETLGKWPLGDLTFGIMHHIRREGNLQVASEFAGNECVQLKGHEILVELIWLQRLLKLCFSFSRETFRVLLESAGCSVEDVLLKEAKGRFLRPAFTILRDRNSKTILVLIRGALSLKDKLTAATCAVVPFQHVSHEGSISNLVKGYAHSGMVVAARWLAESATPCLQKAMLEHPDYNLKIVGHSMGAGVAAILTYILREHKEFSSSTCVAFGPACCMTWNLAESGKHFVTSVINATDLVPTFSEASVSNLRNEVGGSSWLKNIIQQSGFLNGICRFANSLTCCLPFLSIAKTEDAGVDELLEPVPNGTEVVSRETHNIAKAAAISGSSLTSWSCTARGRPVLGTYKDSNMEDAPTSITASGNISLVSDWFNKKPASVNLVNGSKASNFEEIHDRQGLLQSNRIFPVASVEEITQDQFWFVLEDDICKHDQGVPLKWTAVSDIKQDTVLKDMLETKQLALANVPEDHQLFPPGRTMHIVALPALDSDPGEDVLSSRSIGIYETPRHLYGKIRLSQTMIDDHYMPRYKLMMELLIAKLKTENSACTTVVT